MLLHYGARVNKQRIGSGYNIVLKDGLDPRLDLPRLMNDSTGRQVVLHSRVEAGSYGTVFEGMEGRKKIAVKRLKDKYRARNPFDEQFGAPYLKDRLVPQDVYVVERMESCSETYKALHVTNAKEAFVRFEYVRDDKRLWTEFLRLRRGVNGWLILEPHRIPRNISIVETIFYQVLEHCVGDLSSASPAAKSYITNVPILERLEHFKNLIQTLRDLMICSGLVLIDAKRQNTLLTLDDEMYPYPLIGDLGSFFILNDDQGISTYSIVPSDHERAPMRTRINVAKYAGRIGVVVAYILADAVLLRQSLSGGEYAIFEMMEADEEIISLYKDMQQQDIDDAEMEDEILIGTHQSMANRYMRALTSVETVIKKRITSPAPEPGPSRSTISRIYNYMTNR